MNYIFGFQLLPWIDPHPGGPHCVAFGCDKSMGLSTSIPDHGEPKRQLGKGRKRNKNIFQAGFHALAQGEKTYSQVLNPSNQGLLLESVIWP